MIANSHLSLLQFPDVIDRIRAKCTGARARKRCDDILPQSSYDLVRDELLQTNELAHLLSAGAYFPGVEHIDVTEDLIYLGLEGSLLSEKQLLDVMGTASVSNTMVRFLREKRTDLPHLSALSENVPVNDAVVQLIGKVIDNDGEVRSNASADLHRIRRDIGEKRRESDRRFYSYLNELRKLGYVRDNEEGFYNGRRTIAVMVEYKAEVNGLIHAKSESGRTIFIEPGVTISINNDVSELEMDERREVNRLLRELCNELRPYSAGLRSGLDLLITMDFLRARALFAFEINGVLPEITNDGSVHLRAAMHPLLFLKNRISRKPTIPLELDLDEKSRILVISGPNAGGKTIALKTLGLMQVMLQSGLLIPVKATSRLSFFENILIDIGDAQSIENELSTYSAKLKSMTRILESANQNALVLMDEFGSGTDPDLGSAIAEVVLESLVASGARGIITSHFGNVKLLAEQLPGAVNGSMLFDMDTLESKYLLSVGQPGSSYTFEVAEKTGFPPALIEKARSRVNRDQLRLSRLLGEVQREKVRLDELQQQAEHERFLAKMEKEKYNTLFRNWQEKIDTERERKIELSRLAEYGRKYLRLMEDWNQREDRKRVIQRFIDGITAETRIREANVKQQKKDVHAEKKIARLRPLLKAGSEVRVLNSNQSFTVDSIKDDKVVVRSGIMTMTVGIENVILVKE